MLHSAAPLTVHNRDGTVSFPQKLEGSCFEMWWEIKRVTPAVSEAAADFLHTGKDQ